MGYGYKIPANQLGKWKKVWVRKEYGLCGVWVTRGLTVHSTLKWSLNATGPRKNTLTHTVFSQGCGAPYTPGVPVGSTGADSLIPTKTSRLVIQSCGSESTSGMSKDQV